MAPQINDAKRAPEEIPKGSPVLPEYWLTSI